MINQAINPVTFTGHLVINMLRLLLGIFSVPPADELRRLVYLHGGRYQQYYTKRTVTHIIATNLPNSKIQEIRYIDN